MKANDLDEVAFDYLEGNLLPEEKDAFEMLMADSEVIAHEVKLWKKSYFDEPLPDVQLLEGKLLRGDSNYRGGLISRILILLIAISPLWFTMERSVEAIDNQPEVRKLSAHQDVVHDCEGIYKTVAFTKEPFQKSEVMSESSVEQLVAWDLRAIDVTDLTHREKILFDLNEISIVKPTGRNKSNVKKFSRREIRSINKKKREEFEQRSAAKFMKGNVPYVVPLNPNF